MVEIAKETIYLVVKFSTTFWGYTVRNKRIGSAHKEIKIHVTQRCDGAVHRTRRKLAIITEKRHKIRPKESDNLTSSFYIRFP